MNGSARAAATHFQLPGRLLEVEPYGSGHINDTFLAHTDTAGAARFVLQRVNGEIFRDPVGLMDNWSRVSEHLRARLIQREESDAERRSLVPLRAADGRAYHIDDAGSLWRVLPYIQGSRSFDRVVTSEQAFEAARAFGAFARELVDLPGPPLLTTIPNFHDLGLRLAALRSVARADPRKRADGVRDEIERLTRSFSTLDRELLENGADRLPRRVVHHDCKINNVLFDVATGRALCVIDLDTTMPGSVLSDLGELMRTTSCRSPEDEVHLASMSLDLDLVRALARGYLTGAAGLLTLEELRALPLAGLALALMNAIRFMTDYLSGDVYFRVHREGHNLDRCRAQLRLAELLYERLAETREIFDVAVRELEVSNNQSLGRIR